MATHENLYLRAARRCVLTGMPIPADVSEHLIAQGIDVGELERRLIETQEYKL